MAQSANMDASELARDIAAGLASATTATERAALVPAELVEAIQQLKTQRDAVILAHYYVCLLYTSPSPRDPKTSRMPSSA